MEFTGSNKADIKEGTDQDDIFRGLKGNDIFSGESGDDQLLGGDGNDVLYGSSDDDTLIGGRGNDALFGGWQSDLLQGEAGADILLGGTDRDVLVGGRDNDELTGGSDRDAFVFWSRSRNEGVDRIIDFSSAEDQIRVFVDGFGGSNAGLETNAFITPEQFVTGAQAGEADDRFIYNPNTGALFFDIDGLGGSRQKQLAILPTGLSLTNSNIFVTDSDNLLLPIPFLPMRGGIPVVPMMPLQTEPTI